MTKETFAMLGAKKRRRKKTAAAFRASRHQSVLNDTEFDFGSKSNDERVKTFTIDDELAQEVDQIHLQRIPKKKRPLDDQRPSLQPLQMAQRAQQESKWERKRPFTNDEPLMQSTISQYSGGESRPYLKKLQEYQEATIKKLPLPNESSSGRNVHDTVGRRSVASSSITQTTTIGRITGSLRKRFRGEPDREAVVDLCDDDESAKGEDSNQRKPGSKVECFEEASTTSARSGNSTPEPTNGSRRPAFESSRDELKTANAATEPRSWRSNLSMESRGASTRMPLPLMMGLEASPPSSVSSPPTDVCKLLDLIEREDLASARRVPKALNFEPRQTHPTNNTHTSSGLNFSKRNGGSQLRPKAKVIVPGSSFQQAPSIIPRKNLARRLGSNYLSSDSSEGGDNDRPSRNPVLKTREDGHRYPANYRSNTSAPTNVSTQSQGISPSQFHKKQVASPSFGMRRTGKLSEFASIFNDDDEYEPEFANPIRVRPKVLSICKEMELVRIAIGKTVHSLQCRLRLQQTAKESVMTLKYLRAKGEKPMEHNIQLNAESVEEMKYWRADANGDEENDPLCFIAMRIRPDEENGLVKLTNSYLPSYLDDKRESALIKKYIVVEFQSNDEMSEILKLMRNDSHFGAFADDASKIGSERVSLYARVLLNHANEERKKKEFVNKSPRTHPRRARRLGARADNAVLLVYPFPGDRKDIENAANGLTVAGVVENPDLARKKKKPVNLDFERDSDWPSSDEAENPESSDTQDPNGKEPSGSRAHYLTIREEDRDRLAPGEFLNDTLIDFWMQWIWRNEDKASSSVHFLTSHFFTTLSEEGVSAVTSWTAKKNINIFSKKFVFIPINKSLHWSLCVVINPGAIMQALPPNRIGVANGDTKLPCILFLDSLKAHRKAQVARMVRRWLNSEWRRLGMSEGDEGPFTDDTMRLFDPKIPYQDNSCDCGVYVCRYVYGFYLIRDREFTYNDVATNSGRETSLPFQKAITACSAFQFNGSDVMRLRREIAELIDRLSAIYNRWKLDSSEKAKKGEESKAKKGEESKEGDQAPPLATIKQEDLQNENTTYI